MFGVFCNKKVILKGNGCRGYRGIICSLHLFYFCLLLRNSGPWNLYYCEKISFSHPLKGIHSSLQQYLLSCSVNQELYWVLKIYVVYILTCLVVIPIISQAESLLILSEAITKNW